MKTKDLCLAFGYGFICMCFVFFLICLIQGIIYPDMAQFCNYKFSFIGFAAFIVGMFLISVYEE